ncbi:putative mRNA splicing factor [Patellaria atrata CBS 101060]|uniref:Pre-mRNA-splicing factor 18 n=1 Tax=Patellaria atrata CBS 101060 TaxID=1346257 RepID=A0A9P4VU02_9PEZI|nr:putative mRNA splicing factor [Patellaria atrata CBS 101060]
MDFAKLMQSQISKAKIPPKTTSSSDPAPKKYLKRSEIEAQKQAAYLAEQEALEKQRLERLEKKRKLEDEELEKAAVREEKKRRLAEESRLRREEEEEAEERARRKRLGLADLPPKSKNAEEDGTPVPEDEDIADDELIAKLRELGEPARLFGEMHKQRLRRYKKIMGIALKPKMSDGPIPTTLELVFEKDMKVPTKVPKDAEGRKFLFRQLASYFDMVFREWAIAMARRLDDVKTSFQGKAAFNAMVQARDNMIPFFRKLEKGELDDGILDPVVEIVRASQERRYVDANDGYLTLSIGKAAWPIGVTMVGIHERSAREKLHESDKNAAHIMSDEVTRKYLQSIKRCLSFAQTRWPPDDQLQLMG